MKFYRYTEEALEQQDDWINEKIAEEKVDDFGHRALFKLLYIAEKGLPDCYESFEEYLFDFYPSLPWNLEGQKVAIQTIQKDPRFESEVVPAILRDWNYDMKKELEEALTITEGVEMNRSRIKDLYRGQIWVSRKGVEWELTEIHYSMLNTAEPGEIVEVVLVRVDKWSEVRQEDKKFTNLENLVAQYTPKENYNETEPNQHSS